MAQSRQADAKFKESVAMAAFHAASDEIMDRGSKARHDDSTAECDKIWTGPDDAEDPHSRSLKDCYQGTFDGSSWHDVIGTSGDYDVVSKHASKTILRLHPAKFKDAVSKLQKSFERAHSERWGHWL